MDASDDFTCLEELTTASLVAPRPLEPAQAMGVLQHTVVADIMKAVAKTLGLAGQHTRDVQGAIEEVLAGHNISCEADMMTSDDVEPTFDDLFEVVARIPARRIILSSPVPDDDGGSDDDPNNQPPLAQLFEEAACETQPKKQKKRPSAVQRRLAPRKARIAAALKISARPSRRGEKPVALLTLPTVDEEEEKDLKPSSPTPNAASPVTPTEFITVTPEPVDIGDDDDERKEWGEVLATSAPPNSPAAPSDYDQLTALAASLPNDPPPQRYKHIAAERLAAPGPLAEFIYYPLTWLANTILFQRADHGRSWFVRDASSEDGTGRELTRTSAEQLAAPSFVNTIDLSMCYGLLETEPFDTRFARIVQTLCNTKLPPGLAVYNAVDVWEKMPLTSQGLVEVCPAYRSACTRREGNFEGFLDIFVIFDQLEKAGSTLHMLYDAFRKELYFAFI